MFSMIVHDSVFFEYFTFVDVDVDAVWDNDECASLSFS